jgi:hypothetical protein
MANGVVPGIGRLDVLQLRRPRSISMNSEGEDDEFSRPYSRNFLERNVCLIHPWTFPRAAPLL